MTTDAWLLCLYVAGFTMLVIGLLVWLRWSLAMLRAEAHRKTMDYNIDREVLANRLKGPQALALAEAIELVSHRRHARRLFWAEAPVQDYDMQLRPYMSDDMFKGFFPERDLPYIGVSQADLDSMFAQAPADNSVRPLNLKENNDD